MTDEGKDARPALSRPMFYFLVLNVAISNFLAIMNMTVANVALPTIAGGLGISSTQGTWIVTFYAIAEAITVPLTGWLATRFGSVRVFCIAFLGFGVASIFCGLAGSLVTLVMARMMQGFSGGLLMPLSQTILLRIFPKDKAAEANTLWSVTTLVAPVVGPILGGYLCDNYTWPWAFYIDAPLAFLGAIIVWRILSGYDPKPVKLPIDGIGLGLLVIWITALQTTLDEGKNLDWFASDEIRILSGIAVIGFIMFMIWELTERQPVVDVRVFRHRGFSAAVLTIMLAFGGLFGVNVLVSQWLQTNMGYTATWSGKAVAWMGVLAVVVAPFVPKLLKIIDQRAVASFGIVWMALTMIWLGTGNSDMTFWDVSLPFLFMGVGLPLFMVPANGIALASVDEHELNTGAGLMNFMRTLAGAFSTSLTTTAWEDSIKYNHAELAAVLNTNGANALQGLPMDLSRGDVESAREFVNRLVTGQSISLSTNHVLLILAAVLFLGALTIWAAPKPTRVMDTSRTH